MTSTHVRSCSLTDRWPTTSANNPRKSSANGPPMIDSNWPRDLRAHVIHNDDGRSPPIPRSAEDLFVTDLDENVNVNVNTLHEYTSERIDANVSSVKQRNETALRRGQRQINDSSELNPPQAMLAVQRLERLKELQKRRDLTEKYYSQEIRRVIGEHYFGPRLSALVTRANDQIIDPAVYQYPENRPKSVFKTLEACGTMTTITRLDCGCMQQTTRPIFTTIRGRVNERPCNQSQDQVHLRLTSSGPKEHLYATPATPKHLPYYAIKPKQRSLMSPTAYTKVSAELSNEIQDNYNDRNASQKTEITGRTVRPSSPLRAYTDSSSASL